MVSDGGQVSDVNEFQEDQGINVDDEEALAVEKGEFAQPPPPIRRLVKSKQVQAVAKRAASVASDIEEGGKKKKSKKA
jgi:hypothetical protein